MGGHAEKRGLPPFDVLVMGTRIHLCRSNGYSDLYFHTVEGQEGLH